MPSYSIDGVIPVVDPSAYVHPTAVLIGDVIVGPNCYVGPCASLRGDFGRIVLEEGSNVQDHCCIHGFPDNDTVVEVNGHIGHGAILHSCIVRRDALVGMNAPARSLVAGIPAKVKRELTDDEIAWKLEGTQTYQALTVRSLASLHEVAPLARVEQDRPRLPATDVRSLIATKRG